MTLNTFMSLPLTLATPLPFHPLLAATVVAPSRRFSVVFHHDWRPGTINGVKREDLGGDEGSDGLSDELGTVGEARGRGKRRYCGGAGEVGRMAAWDEVEDLSAAAIHARDRLEYHMSLVAMVNAAEEGEVNVEKTIHQF